MTISTGVQNIAAVFRIESHHYAKTSGYQMVPVAGYLLGQPGSAAGNLAVATARYFVVPVRLAVRRGTA